MTMMMIMMMMAMVAHRIFAPPPFRLSPHLISTAIHQVIKDCKRWGWSLIQRWWWENGVVDDDDDDDDRRMRRWGPSLIGWWRGECWNWLSEQGRAIKSIFGLVRKSEREFPTKRSKARPPPPLKLPSHFSLTSEICLFFSLTSEICLFIGPRSDHSLPMSVTHWLTD